MPRGVAAHVFCALVALAVACSVAGGMPYAAAATGDTVGTAHVEAAGTLARVGPSVEMRAGVLRTLDGRTLWSRNEHAELPMASTTKIMTALVVLDHADLSDTVVVSERAAAVGEAEVDLVPGQQLTVAQLLEAMLVRSANDAAYALAEHVAGSVEDFVSQMNEKAVSLGLADTSFANPHGLDEAGHHTSAEDLATLATVAMADPRFAAIVSHRSVSMPGPDGLRRYDNSNKLLGTYPGANGVKTGWTNGAGYCVVASAERSGVGLVAVVLGARSQEARFEEARALLDWGFDHYSTVRVASADSTAALVPVTDYLDVTVPAVVERDAIAGVFDLDGEVETKVQAVPGVKAPVRRGQTLGTLKVVQGDRLLVQVPIVASCDVPRPTVFEQAGIWLTRTWRRMFGGSVQAAQVSLM